MDLNFAHTLSPEDSLLAAESSLDGLSSQEAQRRLERFGANKLPDAKGRVFYKILAAQFKNPLIYILLLVALISLSIGHFTDAFFVLVVLLFNALIGVVQEYSAEKSALALKKLSSASCTVLRNGHREEIDSSCLTIGDIILLESGDKLAADARILECNNFNVDESLLTGESFSVEKIAREQFAKDAVISDRRNMGFAGTFVLSGRAKALVTGIAGSTVLGEIAKLIDKNTMIKTPLIMRMERFSKKLALSLGFVFIIIALLLIGRGEDIAHVLMVAVALGVAVIPEGLPVAMTVALSIASRRMAKRNVIVRKLSAVEALGSCTYIGTDKTGTLTQNQLRLEKVLLPGSAGREELELFYHSAILCNEANLQITERGELFRGDAVDVAFLRASIESGIDPLAIKRQWGQIRDLPFESETQFCAGLYRGGQGELFVCVKGAPEKVLGMCLNVGSWDEKVLSLSKKGYRTLAVAGKHLSPGEEESVALEAPSSLEFLGLAAMIDPPRPDAKESVELAHIAGIKVGMITGDHPLTARAIAEQIGIAKHDDEDLSGKELLGASANAEIDRLIRGKRIFARVEPAQKLKIVESLKRDGEYVAVTGDGANDAPALKAAHVGIAMGKGGTDVARESSDLIITDDKFSSIIAGIEEGRVAYANIRKVVYLLLTTGFGELVLFGLSLIFNMPMPLNPIQLLWLNLVTNGIQDVALAFEKKEGDILKIPPRPPGESIFNSLMIQRVGLSAICMGTVAFIEYWRLLDSGVSLPEAQNKILLLMVLFENTIIGNARSETKSSFFISPLKNLFLLLGVIAAQSLHLLAMHWEGLGKVLGAMPISLGEWSYYLALAVSVFIMGEIQKFFLRGSSLR